MSNTSSRAVIFVGPSLPPAFRRSDLRLDWHPPVKQGELYRAALGRPAIIGIIDGYFEVVPTVWHKEILWAMAHGIHVYGSASIGALRAAELDVFGMKGIGRIFEDFRNGVLVDDDEVAVLHGPEELGYPPLTEAMVNIRVTLAAAIDAGVLDMRVAADLTTTAKALFYKNRTYEAVLQLSGLPDYTLRNFTNWLPIAQVDQKRSDALALIEIVRAHLAAGVEPLPVSYRFADTAAWQATQRRAEEPRYTQ